MKDDRDFIEESFDDEYFDRHYGPGGDMSSGGYRKTGGGGYKGLVIIVIGIVLGLISPIILAVYTMCVVSCLLSGMIR